MPKQIIIDYEEYLELDRMRKVIEDLKVEFEYGSQYAEDVVTKGVTVQIEMPESFRNLFSYQLYNCNVTKLIMNYKEENK